MSHALALDSRSVALELHQLLQDLDPSRWRSAAARGLRVRCAKIEAVVSGVLRSNSADLEDPDSAPLNQRLLSLGQLLRDEVPEEGLPARDLRKAWSRFRKRLLRAYESLSEPLESLSVELPELRPTNYMRSAVHLLAGVMVIVLIEEVLSPRGRWLAPFCVASTMWSLEFLRQRSRRGRAMLVKIFKPIVHPHEHHRINSSTYYATALTLLGLVSGPLPGAVAMAILGFGDPAAAAIGRRYGKTRLVGPRSLEGSLAFVAAGTIAALAVMLIWHGDMSVVTMLLVALGAAFFGALAELFSGRLDDNFSIPLVAGAAASAALYFSGAL